MITTAGSNLVVRK